MAPTRDRSAPSNPTGVTIGIVSRAAFSRECLIRCLAQEPDLAAVDLGAGGLETLERARAANPDLVLIDLPPAEACTLAEGLVQTVPGTLPMAVHRSSDVEELVRLAEAGYVGFVSTDCSFRDLLREARAAHREEPNCPPRLAGALLRTIRSRQSESQEHSDRHLDVLSRREREVAALLERRYSNKEIATELKIEFGTVKNHVHSVLTKLHVHNRWEVPHLGRRRSGPPVALASTKPAEKRST